MDPDQTQQNVTKFVGSDLDPKCLILTVLFFLKNSLKQIKNSNAVIFCLFEGVLTFSSFTVGLCLALSGVQYLTFLGKALFRHLLSFMTVYSVSLLFIF